MDTDLLAIVVTATGGLILCLGGRERLPDGTAAIRALSWDEVEAVRDRFRTLNPYGDGEGILELEEENYVPCTCGKKHKSAKGCTGERRQLYTYSIASKRYALFNLDASGDVVLRGIGDGDDIEDGMLLSEEAKTAVRKYSQHGFGAYEAPRDPETDKKIEKWEREVWQILINRALGRPVDLPAWVYQPALTQIRISTPEQLRWFDTCNRTATGKTKPYPERVKPFNFLSHAMRKPLSALPDRASPDRFCLVAPAGQRLRFVNRHGPKGPIYTAGIDLTPKTYADLIAGYDLHPERKFAGADGQPCRTETRELLQDQPLVVSDVRHVGKEGNHLEAHRAGMISETERQLEFHDSAFEDLVMALREIPTKVIAEATGYNPRTARQLKREEFRPIPKQISALLACVSSASAEQF